MKINIDKFVPRAILFAVINAVIMALLFIFAHPKMPDYNIVYGTLATCALACIFEPWWAIKHDRRPDVGLFGAQWFGAIMAGIIVLLITWI